MVDRIGELTRTWEALRATPGMTVPEELTAELLNHAHAGSWLAANMLYLQGTDWDNRVAGVPYQYGAATVHTDHFGQLELRYDGFSHDVNES